MSLFIGGLAFGEGGPRFGEAKIGIFAGSLVAAAAGSSILWAVGRPREGGEASP